MTIRRVEMSNGYIQYSTALTTSGDVTAELEVGVGGLCFYAYR